MSPPRCCGTRASIGCAANVKDVTQAHALVHGEETDVFADACYQGVGKRDETQDIQVNWHVAMGPAKRKVLDKSTPMGAILDQLERANVEHPFRVIKRQFGHVEARYRGLAKNTAIAHAVCTVQPVDGAAHAAAGDAGMSVSECGRSAAKQVEIGLHTNLARRKSSPSEITCSSSRCGGCSTDLS
jgi:hypothetical protein